MAQVLTVSVGEGARTRAGALAPERSRKEQHGRHHHATAHGHRDRGDPVAGRARAHADVRSDGRDQHGQRRVPDGRGLRGLRDPAGHHRRRASRSWSRCPSPSSSPACSAWSWRCRSSSGCTNGRSTRCSRPSACRWCCNSWPATSSAPRATRSPRRVGWAGDLGVRLRVAAPPAVHDPARARRLRRAQRGAEVQLVRSQDPRDGAEPGARRDGGRSRRATSTASRSSSARAWPASAAWPSP